MNYKQYIKEQNTFLEVKALKYDTAEEFIKNQGPPLYHGTYLKLEKLMTTRELSDEIADTVLGYGQHTFGIYLTPKKELAKKFGNNIIECYVYVKNMLDLRNISTFEMLATALGVDIIKEKYAIRNMKIDSCFNDYGFKDDIYRPLESLVYKFKIEDELQEKYNGIIFNDREGSVYGETYIIFNSNNIKTKQQLINIWNRVTSK